MSLSSTLTFLGGAGTVTGSKHLVETGGARVLLDCGLFQGLKALRLRNWQGLPVPARDVDAVVLSHAHIDHTGYLPALVHDGFRGPVHCSAATAEIVPLLLRDSARLQEEDADRANRHGYSKHPTARPLYTTDDARDASERLTPHAYHEPFALPGGAEAVLRRAGHILGAATVELTLGPGGTKLVFSGDLGRWDRPILRDPEAVPEADVLLVESTYGDRVHAARAEDELARIVNETIARGGTLVVPAFAVGRTQELMWTLRALQDAQRIPRLPVYVDSPLGADVTAAYCKHPEEHDLDMAALTNADRCPLCCHGQRMIRTVDESKALNGRTTPSIIIAGSGMATGGRVLHHLARRLPDPRNTVLLVGYQAEGTRGRELSEGARLLKMHGVFVPVRAQVERLDGLSAHADQNDLMRWLRGFRTPPRQTYVVHGEASASAALAAKITAELGWAARVAIDGETVSLPAPNGAT